MPCYLFTYHAYGSWMPDRRQGYVDRKRGLLPPDPGMAEAYREGMEETEAVFNEEHQLTAINSLLESAEYYECRIHHVATEPSHIHALVSWTTTKRTWLAMRSSLKKSITIDLKEVSVRKRWLSEGASRKRVLDQTHFDHLVTTYLPSHRGWKWGERQGFYR